MSNVSTFGRHSSQILTQYGAQKTNITKNGTTSSIFNFAHSNERFIAFENYIFSTERLVRRDSIKSVVIDNATSHFIKLGRNRPTAQAMALLIIDAAELQGANVIAVLEHITNNNIDVYKALAPYINKLRVPGTQHEIVSSASNNNSKKSRDIII